MDALKRWALAAGLLLGLVWAGLVSASMPSWWDAGKACFDKFGPLADPDPTVRTSWLPPSVTCDFGGGDVRDYLSTAQTTIFSITGILILALITAGIVFQIQRLKGDPGPTRSADGIDLTRRRRNHLLYGGLDVLVVVAILTSLNAAAVLIGEVVGGILFVITAVTVLAALAGALDRHTGPLPTTALASRRRGAATGAILFGAIFAATALTGQLPFYRLWAAPLAAIMYAAIVHWQWTKAETPAAEEQVTT